MHNLTIDTGQRFGRLTVINPGLRLPVNNNRAALCVCDCGEQSIVALHNLRRTLSCGCLRREVSRSPEALSRLAEGRRSPQRRERQAQWARSPEHVAFLSQFWTVPRTGSNREPVGRPDPDWCAHHDLSRYDHRATRVCRYG